MKPNPLKWVRCEPEVAQMTMAEGVKLDNELLADNELLIDSNVKLLVGTKLLIDSELLINGELYWLTASYCLFV